MSTSSDTGGLPEPPVESLDWRKVRYERLQVMRAEAEKIAAYAISEGLDVDSGKVLRYIATFRLWYAGGLHTGYLMRMTGIKEIKYPK